MLGDLAIHMHPADQPHAARLTAFKEAHPGVVIDNDPGWWQARITEPDGETVITRHRLGDLLDKLEDLPPEGG